MSPGSSSMTATQLHPAVDKYLQDTLQAFDFAFTVSNPQEPDNPICFASQKFYESTGYGPEHVIGKNCRFLQGPKTERRKVMEIRDAIREERSCQVCLLNYRRDGTPFWNEFHLSPIRDEQGNLIHYIGIQSDVTAHVGELREQVLCEVERGVMDNTASLDEDVQEVVAVELQEAAQLEHVLKAEPKVERATSPLPCSLRQSLMDIQSSFVLSDPNLPDMPIVHASQKFLELTGYPRHEVVGRNCRFLQGLGTDPEEVGRLRDAVRSDPPQAVTVTLLNYRKDGTPFWNSVHVAPIRDAGGRVTYFVGVQLDVTEAAPGEAAVHHARGSLADGGSSSCSSSFSEASLQPQSLTLAHKVAHKSVTGAVRVAARSLGGATQGLRRSVDCQGLPRMQGRAYSMPCPSGLGSRSGSQGQGLEGGPEEVPRHAISAPAALASADIVEGERPIV